MEQLSNIGVIRDVLSRHGFTFSKSLGQNFLINPAVCPRMAELGGAGPGVGMLEIGAGIGVLTAELAKRADKVVCVEIDTRLLPVLDETLAGYDNIERVEILPNHTLGVHKYEAMGLKYALADTPRNTPEQLESVRALFASRFSCPVLVN